MTGDPARRTSTGRPLRLVRSTDEGTDDRDRYRDDPGTDEDALTVDLPPQRRSVAVGRHWVVRVAAEQGVTGMANQVLELLTSELLANAVLHATAVAPDRPLRLEFARDDAVARVAVTDHAHQPPVVLHPEPVAPAGRGMAIVEAMSERWGVAEAAQGKTVWFEIALDEY